MATLSRFSTKPIVPLSPSTEWVICYECGYVIATVVARDPDALSRLIREVCRVHRKQRGKSRHSSFRVANGVWREEYGTRANVIWND